MSDSKRKVAVVGNKDSILIFKSLGMSVHFVDDSTDPRDIMKKLVAAEHPIILITENEAMKIGDYLDARSAHPYPIIIPIPDGVHEGQYGLQRILKKIEKAIGSTGGFSK